MSTAATTASLWTRRDVWLISFGHALTHWYPATFYLLLPIIGQELGLSYTQIGLIITVQFTAGAISNLPGGMIVDSIGKKGYLMALSLFWVGFPYALMSITTNFWMLLACVTLVGIGNNIWHPAAIPTLAHGYPDRKGLVLSFHGMGGNLGEALAPLVVGALLTWFSWRTVVVLNVMPGLVMAIMILLMLGALSMDRENPAGLNAGGDKRGMKEYLRDCGTLLKNKTLLLVSVSAAFRTMTQVGLATFLPVYLSYELGYSTFMIGLCVTLIQVAGFIAGPIGGHVSDKMGRRRVIMSSTLLSAVMILGMVFSGTSPVFVLFVALTGFFLYAMRPVLQAWVIECTPKHLAATGVGLQFGILAVGAAISPAIFGLIADHFSVYTAFYFLAGTIVLANVLIFFVPQTGAEPRAAAA